jgi:hypothetical protein
LDVIILSATVISTTEHAGQNAIRQSKRSDTVPGRQIMPAREAKRVAARQFGIATGAVSIAEEAIQIAAGRPENAGGTAAFAT